MGYGKITKEEALRREELFKLGIIVCSQCKRELPFNMFTKEKCKKNGYASLCKDCQKERREKRKDKIQNWRTENKEKLNEYFRNYSKSHAEAKKAYNQANKEYFKLKRKEYESENLEKVQKQRRKLRQKPIEKYRKYKRDAEQRNLDFCLTYEEFEHLITQPCYYCGNLPENEFGNKYTGIDRIDSSRGYTVGNCIPCCFMCNHMKSNRNVNVWIDKMSQILSHLKSIGYISPSSDNPEELQFNDNTFNELSSKIQKG